MTERRSTRAKRKPDDPRIGEILESISDAFCALDRDFRYSYVNARAAELLELPRDKLLGECVWDLFPYAVGTEVYRNILQAMEERVARSYEACDPTSDRWFENHVYPTKQGVSIYWREITQRKLREKELQRSQESLAEGQRLTKTGSWGWTLATGEVFWSEQQFRLYDLDPRGAPPSVQGCLQLIHPEDRDFIAQKLAGMGSEPRDYEWDCRVVTANGSVKHVHTTAHPILEDGVPVEYLGTTMDVTERIQAEDALRRTQEALARVTRVMLMGELMASVAHELNQPLAAVVAHGNAGVRWLTHQPADLEEAHHAFERIVRDGTRAGEVLRRIRSLVTKNAPPNAPLDVGRLVSDTLTLLQDEARAGNVTVRQSIEPDLPAIEGDAVRLQQALCNLVLNGIEAMSGARDRPRVLTVGVKRASSGAVQVTVRDSGCGFDLAASGSLFEPFYTTKAAGLGMGLAISRTIIESLGGKLSATSDSEGATFGFALPVSPAT